MRDKLIKILREPIFLHELADPTEAVADYLLDNDVVPVVRCKYCVHWDEQTGFCDENSHFYNFDMCWDIFEENDFCSYGERRTDNA